jgi:hypothetical protein
MSACQDVCRNRILGKSPASVRDQLMKRSASA